MSAATDHPQRDEILSQDETDALLKGIEDGSVATNGGHGQPSGDIRLYDFAGCERLARGSMPTLQIVNERFAQGLGKLLADLLRKQIEVEAVTNQVRRFGEFVPTLPFPASLNLVQMRPLPGKLLIVPDHRLIYITVDCFFGGKGTLPEDAPVRDFTQVEKRIVTMLLDCVFNALTEAWRPVFEIAPELIGQEQNAHFAAIARKRERVIVTDFCIRHADQEATLQVVTPLATFVPIEEILDSAPRSDDTVHDERWTKAMVYRLAEASIGLQATLTQTTLQLGEVLSLQSGDVIPVELPDKIALESGGIPLFVGRAGASRKRNAIAISDRADPDQATEKTERTTYERRTYDAQPIRQFPATD